MPVREIYLLITLGLMTGFASGVLGIGGGVVLVPALVYMLGYSQHLAQGTTLALLCMPVGLVAAVSYHRHGFVDWKVAFVLFLGILAGSLAGSKLALIVPDLWLKRLFGICLLSVGARMLLSR